MLIVEEAVKLTDYSQPICMPSPFDSSYNVEGTIVGHGYISQFSGHQLTPHHAKLQSISPTECLKTHVNALRIVSLENSFCAKSDTSAPCRGKKFSKIKFNVNFNVLKVRAEVLLWCKMKTRCSGNF